MKVMKQNGTVVNYDNSKIINAVMDAMRETEVIKPNDPRYIEGGFNGGENLDVAFDVTSKVENDLKSRGDMRTDLPYSVDEIHNLVEKYLSLLAPQAAKRYIIYREGRARKTHDRPFKYITDDFYSQYKHLPSPMKQFGNFVYYRTYSRWLPEEKRRESWAETVRRHVEYNCSLSKIQGIEVSKKEAEALFDNIFYLRQFLSGRTMWIGNTLIAEKHPIGNYNCSHTVLEEYSAFRDIFYLSMVGSGIGINVRRKYIDKLPKIRSDFQVIHVAYEEKAPIHRVDHTSLEFEDDNTVNIIIGDSKEGWVESLEHFFELLTSFKYRSIKSIRFIYDNVRPKGEKLKTFGGTASGHESLLKMYKGIEKIIKAASSRNSQLNVKLEPIDCVDISNTIGLNVVSGGVRRTAQIILCDPDDKAVINAKINLYSVVDGKFVKNKDLMHREMSNNSIIHPVKPERQLLHEQFVAMAKSGEPGFVNEVAALMRNPNFCGVNPCGEILLDRKGLCNLTTINWMAFVKTEEPDGGYIKFTDSNGEVKYLAVEEAMDAFRLAARASVRMTVVELEMPSWNEIQQRDRLLGVSFTGWQDMVNSMSLSKEQKIQILQTARAAVHDAANTYCDELEVSKPILMTTIKPEGTLSTLPGVSSGVHFQHSEYFIRRVRISADDPLCKVAEKLDWPVFPEVGYTQENCSTKYVEFPVAAPKGRTKFDVSAIEQLEEYLMMMRHYVDHNCSITVHVRGKEEWAEAEQWVWDNWDEVVAISFLDLNDSFYEGLPYEKIDKEEYDRRVSDMNDFIPSLISDFEKEEILIDIGNEGCDSGSCPVR